MPPSLPAPGSVIVHVVDPADIPREQTDEVLTTAEQAQACRFRFEKDALHWRACRTALRQILGERLGLPPRSLEIRLGEHGKPSLAEPCDHLRFNLSHCRDLALIAVGIDGPLGIDLEPADRGRSLLGCESSFCHPDELVVLPREEDRRAAVLLELWTGKEALLKALGTGMSLAPATVSLFPAGPAGAGVDPRLAAFRLLPLEAPRLARHVARIAVPLATRECRIEGLASTSGPGSCQ